ncbi:MAG: NAD-dependent epimerase/dehydratase family protein [Carbonactinosporaceae bacterium]
MRILVMGGTGFVGRAVVSDAIGRGWQVTTYNRGTRPPPDGVEALTGNRLETLAPLDGRTWDAVVDTWDGPASAVSRSASALRNAVGWYGYVSTRSVYRWPLPPGADESAPIVDLPPNPDPGDYAANKRGGEIAVLASFGDRALLVRAGLILGPWEDTGRLTWWLGRVAAGGRVVAPQPAGRPWQYIDARDLARFLLDAAADGLAGAMNLVSPVGHTTTERLIEACVRATGSGADVVWVPWEALAAAGVGPWVDLPGCVPPEGEYAGLHDCDVRRALQAGLHCRPVEQTVSDTWAWMRTLDGAVPLRPGRPASGLPEEKERNVLSLAGCGH